MDPRDESLIGVMLPVGMNNSPIYSVIDNSHFIRPEFEEERLTSTRVHHIPLVGESSTEYDVSRAHYEQFQDDPSQNKVVLHGNSMTEVELDIYANARHIVIPFPMNFMQMTCKTRGQIDKDNAFAVEARKLANTLEFLLSSEGIDLSWAGTLVGEKKPENLDPGDDAAEEDTENDGDNANRPPKKKKSDKATKNLVKCCVRNLEDYVVMDLSKVDNRTEGIIGQPNVQTMQIISPDETQPGCQNVITMPRFQIYWEAVPLRDYLHYSSVVRFSDDEELAAHQKMVVDHNNHLFWSPDVQMGYLLCHFVILDPRISLMKGLRRLADMDDILTRRGPKIRQSGSAESIAANYAITPESYVAMMHILSSLPLSERDDAYKTPDKSIFSEFDPLSMTKVLEIKPEYSYEGQVIKSRWRTSFSMQRYEAATDVSYDVNGIPRPENREQLKFEDRFWKVVLNSNWDGGPIEEFGEPKRVFFFYSPNRVIRIDPQFVHPVILNNCLIPFYNLSDIKNPGRSFNAYKIKADQIFLKGNITCPDMTDEQTILLKNKLEELRGVKDGIDLSCKAAEGYDADKLREDFGARPTEEISVTVDSLSTVPLETANTVFARLCSAVEKPDKSQNGKGTASGTPEPLQHIFDYMNAERHKNADYSLFQDLFEDLGFKHYEDLSIASTYTVNVFEIIDKYWSVHSSHRFVYLMDKNLLLQGNMRYGDQTYVLVTGDSQKSKSYTGEVVTDMAIPGTIERQSHQTDKVMLSGASFACSFTIKDDVSAENEKAVFKGAGNERESDAVSKEYMTSGETVVRRFKLNDDGSGVVNTHKTDLRKQVWANSNSSEGIAPSILTRIMLYKLEDITSRNLTISDLENRARTNHLKNEEYKKKYRTHYRNRQVFSALIWYFIRAGAIQYRFDTNAYAITAIVMKRFKSGLADVVLKRNTIGITPRVERGQIIKLAEAFMIERVYAAICSGVYKEKSKYLKPGAPFTFEFLREINELGLLVPTEEDVIRSLSYFEDVVSQEVLNELSSFLRKKMDAILKKIPVNAADTRDFAMSGEVFTKNMSTAFNMGNRGATGDTLNTFWKRVYHKAGNKIFFKRAIPSGNSGITEYELDYNYLDISTICGLPENELTPENMIDHLTTHIKMNPDCHIDRDLLRASLHRLLVDGEFPYIENMSCHEAGVALAEPADRFPVTPLCTKKMKIADVVMQVRPTAALDPRSYKTARIIMNTAWLSELFKGVDHTAVIKSDCYPPHFGVHQEVPTHKNFKGSSCEKAMHLMSYNGAYEQRIVLPGMPYSMVVPDKDERRKIPGMPHIPRSICIYDLSRNTPQAEHVKGMIESHNQKCRKDNQNRDMVEYSTDLVLGVGDGGKELKWNKESPIHFSTFKYLELIKERMYSWGCQLENKTITGNPEQIKERYYEIISNPDMISYFSPVGAEETFKKIRQTWEEQGNEVVDYETTMVEKEIRIAQLRKRPNENCEYAKLDSVIPGLEQIVAKKVKFSPLEEDEKMDFENPEDEIYSN